MLLPLAALPPIVISVVAVLLLGGEADDPHLVEARRVLATAGFTSERVACAACSFPADNALYEYAPPEDLRVSNYDAREAWQHHLYLDRMAYVSGNGVRWVEGVSLPLLGFLLYDPRVLLVSIDDAQFDRDETIDGDPVRVYRGSLNPDAYISHMPWNIDPELSAAVRENYLPIIDGAAVELWIDESYRVRRSFVRPVAGTPGVDSDEPDESFQRDYRYVRGLVFPDSVPSMSAEEADRLSRMGEESGTRLLSAITEYFRRNGVYPPQINEATLAGVFNGAWPANPFTNEQIRDSMEAGDYTYLMKNNGRDFEFTLHGWENEQLFFDTVRFGPYQGGERRGPP